MLDCTSWGFAVPACTIRLLLQATLHLLGLLHRQNAPPGSVALPDWLSCIQPFLMAWVAADTPLQECSVLMTAVSPGNGCPAKLCYCMVLC